MTMQHKQPNILYDIFGLTMDMDTDGVANEAATAAPPVDAAEIRDRYRRGKLSLWLFLNIRTE